MLGSPIAGNSHMKSQHAIRTHRLLSSSFLGLPYKILNMNQKKELQEPMVVQTPCP